MYIELRPNTVSVDLDCLNTGTVVSNPTRSINVRPRLLCCCVFFRAWANNTLWARPCLTVCRVFLNNGTGGPIVGTHFCATVGSTVPTVWTHCCAKNDLGPHGCKNDVRLNYDLDRINVTKIYVMWREEHLWNVSVLQWIHLSEIALSCAGRHFAKGLLSRPRSPTKWQKKKFEYLIEKFPREATAQTVL
jgi:hypothetical protein